MKIFRFFVLLFGLVAPITLGSVIAQEVEPIKNAPEGEFIIQDDKIYTFEAVSSNGLRAVAFFDTEADARSFVDGLVALSETSSYFVPCSTSIFPVRVGSSGIACWCTLSSDLYFFVRNPNINIYAQCRAMCANLLDSCNSTGSATWILTLYADAEYGTGGENPDPQPDPNPGREIHKITYPITTKREGDFFYQDRVLYTKNDSYSASGKHINGFTLKIYSTPNGWLEGVPDAHGLEVCRTVAEMVVNSFASYVASYDFGGVELEGVSLTPICAPFYSSGYSTSEPLGYIVVLFPSRTGTSYNVGNLCKSCATDFYYNEGWASFYWLGAVGTGDMVNIKFSQNSEIYASKPSRVSTSSFSEASLDEVKNVQSTAELSEGTALPVSVSYVPSVATTVDSGGNLATNTPEVATTSDISVQGEETGEATIVINQETTVNYDFELGDAPEAETVDSSQVEEKTVKDSEDLLSEQQPKYNYINTESTEWTLNHQKLWDDVKEKVYEIFGADKLEEFKEKEVSGGTFTPFNFVTVDPWIGQTWQFTIDSTSVSNMPIFATLRSILSFFCYLGTSFACIRLFA